MLIVTPSRWLWQPKMPPPSPTVFKTIFTENHMGQCIITHEKYMKLISVSKNKVLLEHSHVYLFTCGSLCATIPGFEQLWQSLCMTHHFVLLLGALQIRISYNSYSWTALQMPCVLLYHSIWFLVLLCQKRERNTGFQRTLKAQWSVDYFIKFDFRTSCLLCRDTIAVLKGYRRCKYHQTKHSSQHY